MKIAEFPDDEATRLARLHALAVLDTAPEPVFDALARSAALACGAPIALVSLIDERRQWFKACIGLGVNETPREAAFCSHAILSDELFEVPDATLDERFADNPLVAGEPRIRFYAGAPLTMPDGSRIGTLCVIDREPRRLDDSRRRVLRELASAVVHALLLRERTLDAAWKARSRLETELSQRARALIDAEDAMRESERRFRVLSDSSPVGVFHTDSAGQCTYTNPRWQEIFGLQAAASLGEGWARTLHPEDRSAVFDAWNQAARSGADFAMEYRIQRPDGSVRHVRGRSRAVRADGGPVSGYVGAVEDVTDALAVQRQLRASEAMLDRAGRVARVGGWEVDLATQRVVWSAQTCRIHDREPGYQPSLAEALNHIPLPQRPLLDAAVRECVVTGTSFDLEVPLVTATGRAIWVRIMGEAQREGSETVRLFGAMQDVTARRLAQDALRASQQQLRVLYEATPAMLQSMDAEGRLLTVSDVWLATLGYRREQVVETPAQTYFAPSSRQQLVGEVFPALWQRERVGGVALQMLASDGRVRDVLLSAVLEPAAHGAARRALAFIDDVTEDVARRAELQREQALRRQIEGHAEELNQLLRERSEMLDVLAHEVRQPLNNASAALQGAAVALAGRGEDAATARLLRAQGVMGQVLAGVDNTLAAASLLAGNGNLVRTDTDVDTLIGVTIADIAQPERARIVVERATTTRTATMDMGLVRLALRNLLANALKYSPAGSPVLLRISESDQPLALVLEVHDQGIGFDPVLIPRLFERGARGAHGGHGLGLYIARRVMDLHGGQIELVNSTPQVGTTLRLIIGEAGALDA